VEDQFSLLPNLRLVGGARYDYIQNDVSNRDNGAEYGRDFNPITYRGGLVWEVVTNTTVYGQYSTSADSPRSFVNVGGGLGLSLLGLRLAWQRISPRRASGPGTKPPPA
jgi:outer membrane receptor protein involved in Fe transport